jgi:hypothetical protein
MPVSLVLEGCAEQRVSLRQVQEMDLAVKMAEQSGMWGNEDLIRDHVKRDNLIRRYMDNPGIDPAIQAQRDAAMAMQMQAVNGFIAANPMYQQQAPLPPPMPFNQWRGR